MSKRTKLTKMDVAVEGVVVSTFTVVLSEVVEVVSIVVGSSEGSSLVVVLSETLDKTTASYDLRIKASVSTSSSAL